MSKRKHLPKEVEVEPKKYNKGKRKRPSFDSSPIQNKICWENRNQHQSNQEDDRWTTNSSDWGSDEDDMIYTEHLESLDDLIKGIMNETFTESRFPTIVSEESSLPPTPEPTPTSNEDEIFRMSRHLTDYINLPSLEEIIPVPTSNAQEDYSNMPELLNSPEIFQIYEKLNEEAQCLDGTYGKSKTNHQINSWNRKKSKSESETILNDIFDTNNGLQRSSNDLGSLPDLSFLSRGGGQDSYYTNFLLDQTPSFNNDFSLDTAIVDNYLQNI